MELTLARGLVAPPDAPTALAGPMSASGMVKFGRRTQPYYLSTNLEERKNESFCKTQEYFTCLHSYLSPRFEECAATPSDFLSSPCTIIYCAFVFASAGFSIRTPTGL